jgi:hypothetical protein
MSVALLTTDDASIPLLHAQERFRAGTLRYTKAALLIQVYRGRQRHGGQEAYVPPGTVPGNTAISEISEA